MTDNFINNNNSSSSSIFIGKVRLEDLSAEEKLNELKSAADEIAKKIALKNIELEREACSHVNGIFSQVELHIEEDDDYFAGGIEGLLEKLYEFFKPLLNEFGVAVDQKTYEMLMIEFLRNKLKELIKKIFARDLSFDQRLDKEIKELQEKLGSGELSEAEFARVLERLTALQDLKLKLQMFLVGWVVTMFAEIFGIELTAAVSQETTKEEDKKAEKTSLKEEPIKEVHEEIKVDEREKPKVPVSLFEISPGFVRPVVLSKPELDLLPKPIMPPIFKEVNENREVKETKPKVEEEKKAKPEPKVAVCPPKPAEKKFVVQEDFEVGDNKSRRGDPDENDSDKVIRRSTKRSFPAHDYPIGHYQAPSKTNDESNASAAQQGSVDDVQPPKELTNDVKVEKCVESQSVEKTPSRG